MPEELAVPRELERAECHAFSGDLDMIDLEVSLG